MSSADLTLDDLAHPDRHIAAGSDRLRDGSARGLDKARDDSAQVSPTGIGAPRISKLDALRNETNEVRKNELLFKWLCDDDERRVLYDELQQHEFPALVFKSVLRSGGNANWPNQDVYLLSKKQHIEHALKNFSVAPYAGLGSGGRFMLGIDRPDPHKNQPDPHAVQNAAARVALTFSAQEIEACVAEAYRRASLLPLRSKDNLVNLPIDLAEQTALRFIELLFGLRDEAHLFLQRFMGGAYQALVFQIIGRHFVGDSGLPPSNNPAAKELEEKLKEEIRAVLDPASVKELLDRGLQHTPVIAKLHQHFGQDMFEDLTIVVLGLIAGTIGNVRAAISIAISDLFTSTDKNSRPLIDRARRAAHKKNGKRVLELLIKRALARNPPAAFLARTSTAGQIDGLKDVYRQDLRIPVGSHVLLALGASADDDLVFGGMDGGGFVHRCIGQHLAWPLICYVASEVLKLPGLAQQIDSEGQPKKLEKAFGVICNNYPLRFQRDRLINQQPLHVVLRIKAPVKENAAKLEALTRGGAFVVEDALDKSPHVHFAWFMLVEGGTHLAMMTVYDGDFDAYVEHFATDVDLFDKQLQYLEDAPPLPVKEHPKEFVEWIRRNNRTPLGGYFYSAYPAVSVAQVHTRIGPKRA